MAKIEISLPAGLGDLFEEYAREQNLTIEDMGGGRGVAGYAFDARHGQREVLSGFAGYVALVIGNSVIEEGC